MFVIKVWRKDILIKKRTYRRKSISIFGFLIFIVFVFRLVICILGHWKKQKVKHYSLLVGVLAVKTMILTFYVSGVSKLLMWNIGSHDVQIEHSPLCSYKKQDQLFIIFINACCGSSLQRQVVWSENNKQRQFYNDFDRFFTWTVWGQTYITSSWAFLFWFFSYFNAICDPFLNMNEENGIYWSLGKDFHISVTSSTYFS